MEDYNGRIRYSRGRAAEARMIQGRYAFRYLYILFFISLWTLVVVWNISASADARSRELKRIPETPEVIAQGKKIYEKRCYFCHGIEGRGDGPSAGEIDPSPRDFTKAEYRIRSTPWGSLPTDDDLFRVITNGIRETGMPSWDKPFLTEKERWEVVYYIKTFSKRFKEEGHPEAIKISSPPKATKLSIEHGRQLFNQMKCFLCHGEEGRGDGPITVTLKYEWEVPFRARDLTKGWRFKGGNKLSDIFLTLSTGFNGTPMGSYKSYLSDEERWHLAHYIKSISKDKKIPDGLVIKSLFEKTNLPDSPDDIKWDKAEPIEVPLAGQLLTRPRWWMPSVDSIMVKSMYNNEEVAFLIEWDDPTSSIDELFPDAVSLQFPVEISDGRDRPYFTMGEPGKSVNIWLWEAKDIHGVGVEEMNASGMGTLKRQPDESQQVYSHGVWQNGRWRIIIKRHLITLDTKGDVQFHKNILIPIAMAVWDGTNGEIDARKSLSSWYYLQIESGIPSSVYLYVLIGILSAVILEMWVALIIRRRWFLIPIFVGIFLSNVHAEESGLSLNKLKNPYDRPKNGPPLTDITYKVKIEWLFEWLKDPKGYDSKARMPNLKLADEEIKAVIAFLSSISEENFPKVDLPQFLIKKEEELTEEEFGQLEEMHSKGKGIWGQSRCTICHSVKGHEGSLIGGFVNTRVGPDVSKVAGKVKNDWLYYWIKDPGKYFPDTLMPRFRFSEDEIMALVTFILKDPNFLPETPIPGIEIESSYLNDKELIEKGKRIVELNRCVLCHEIKGVEEIIPRHEKSVSVRGDFEKLLDDVKCLTCHNINGRGGDYAPDLTFEGSKLKKEWIINFLKSPDLIRPLLQQMPKFNLSDEEAMAAVDYIKENFTTSEILTEPFSGKMPAEETIAKGSKLFLEKGCNSCHAIGSGGGALGPNLNSVGDRLEPSYILFHIKNPNRALSYSVEPDYKLSEEEALAITGFLINCKKVRTDK